MKKPPPIELLRAAVEGDHPLRRAEFYTWLGRNPAYAAVLAGAKGRKNWGAVVLALKDQGLRDGRGKPLSPKVASNTWWRFWSDRSPEQRAAILAAEAPPPTEAAPPRKREGKAKPAPAGRRSFRPAADPGSDD